LGFGTVKTVIASRGCDGACVHAVGSLAGGGSAAAVPLPDGDDDDDL